MASKELEAFDMAALLDEAKSHAGWDISWHLASRLIGAIERLDAERRGWKMTAFNVAEMRGAWQTRAKAAEAERDLLVANARIQAKLLADTGRAKEAAEAACAFMPALR
jgi:hypothetical protein